MHSKQIHPCFDALHRLGSKAQRVLIYPDSMDTIISDRRDRDSELLVMAIEKYNVKLVPTAMLAVMEARRQNAIFMGMPS